jgi:hypothetical protein
LISAARKAIYQQNFDVNSAAVERMLKPQSLVPTAVSIDRRWYDLFNLPCSMQNAFSERLAQFNFSFFSLLVIDLMHEVELGVWKALLIHLLRIIETFDESLLHELDRRRVYCHACVPSNFS